MARISPDLLLQRVGDDKLVLIDQNTMNETVISVRSGPRLVAMAAYLTDPDNPGAVWAEAWGQLKQVGAVS